MNEFQGQMLAGAVIVLALIVLYLNWRVRILNARLNALRLTLDSHLIQRTANWYADEGGLVREVGKRQ